MTRSNVLLGESGERAAAVRLDPRIVPAIPAQGPGVPSALTRCSDLFAKRPRSSDATDFRLEWVCCHRRHGAVWRVPPTPRAGAAAQP